MPKPNSLQHLSSPQAAKTWCEAQRQQGHSIGFVATMGALHEGHMQLVHRATAENDRVVASIFVNPLQFNKPEDLENYPRREAEDLQLLEKNGCNMVFTGEINDFYPEPGGLKAIELADAGHFAKGLEGDHRPGHFEGVREIVSRLFTTVGPCRTYFGEKDFQQTLLVKDLAAGMQGIDVVVCPTSREPSGLARSSRNLRLSKTDKKIATRIYQALSAAQRSWQQGERNADHLRQAMLTILDHPQIKIEYAELRDPEHWQPHSPSSPLTNAQALIAAEIGGVRLIDNLRLSDSNDAQPTEDNR